MLLNLVSLLLCSWGKYNQNLISIRWLTVYTTWDIAYRYELEGEIQHETAESYEYEYGYYPAGYWVNDPEYNYPDGVINVTGIDALGEDFE